MTGFPAPPSLLSQGNRKGRHAMVRKVLRPVAGLVLAAVPVDGERNIFMVRLRRRCETERRPRGSPIGDRVAG